MKVYDDPHDDPVLHGSPGDRELARFRRRYADFWPYRPGNPEPATGPRKRDRRLWSAVTKKLGRPSDDDWDPTEGEREAFLREWAREPLRPEAIWHPVDDPPSIGGAYWVRFGSGTEPRPGYWSAVHREWQPFIPRVRLEKQPAEWSSDLFDLDRSPFGGRWSAFMPKPAGSPRKKRGLKPGSMADVARQLSVPTSTLAKWVRRQNCPRDYEGALAWKLAKKDNKPHS